MTGLFTIINNTSRAILANQIAIEIISNNISNVNTDGYHRQEVVFQSGIPTSVNQSGFGGGIGQIGSGVLVDYIKRYSSEFLDKRYRLEQAEACKWEYKGDVLSRVETLFADLGDGGMTTKLDNFWDAWQVLSSDPTNEALRSIVREEGKSLANAFQSRMEILDSVGQNQDVAIKERVLEINSISEKIAKLNLEIGHVTSIEEQPNDLMDQRDQLLDRLAEVAGAVSFNNKWAVDQSTGTYFDTGMVLVSIGGHVVVHGGSTEKLSYNDNTLTFAWEDGQPYQGTNGELTGIVEARSYIEGLKDDVNNLAESLITWVNDVHQTTYQSSTSLATVDEDLLIDGGQFWLGGDGTSAAAVINANNVLTGSAAVAIAGTHRELGQGTFTIETQLNAGVAQFRIRDSDGNIVEIDDKTGSGNLTTDWLTFADGEVYDTGRGLQVTFATPVAGGFLGNSATTSYESRGIDLTNPAETGGAGTEIATGDTLTDIAQKINATQYLQPEGREVGAVIVGNAGSYRLLLIPEQARANHAVIASSNLTGTVGGVPLTPMLTFPSGVVTETPTLFFQGTNARTIRVSNDILIDLDNIQASISSLTAGDSSLANAMADGRDTRSFLIDATNGTMGNINEFYNALATELGLEIDYATSSNNDRIVVSEAIALQREGLSGVNMDDEAVNLLKYQSAFNAAARVITAADEMLKRIIDNLGS